MNKKEKVTLLKVDNRLKKMEIQFKKHNAAGNKALWLWPIALGGSWAGSLMTLKGFSLEWFVIFVCILVLLGFSFWKIFGPSPKR
jgi:hypothetical protein